MLGYKCRAGSWTRSQGAARLFGNLQSSRQVFQQFHHRKLPRGLHRHREQPSRIALVGQRIPGAAEEFREEWRELGLDGCSRLLAIGSEKAVIDEYFHVLPIEANLSTQVRILFQTLTCAQGRLRRLLEPIMIVACERSLAVVANAQPSVGVVYAVISFEADQDHSRPVVDMPVIRDVQ